MLNRHFAVKAGVPVVRQEQSEFEGPVLRRAFLVQAAYSFAQ